MNEQDLEQQGSGRRPPVSIDEVQETVEQIAGGDPSATNAAAIRAELGRGSLTTLQKLLDKLRADVRKSQQPSDGSQSREMPGEVIKEFEGAIEAIWWRAHDRVEGLLRTRLDAVASERDAFRDRADIAERDRDAVQSSHDALVDQVETLEMTLEKVKEDNRLSRSADIQEQLRLSHEQQSRIQELESLVEALTKDMNQAAALAAAERRGLDAIIDRLTEQLADTKAMIRTRLEGTAAE